MTVHYCERAVCLGDRVQIFAEACFAYTKHGKPGQSLISPRVSACFLVKIVHCKSERFHGEVNAFCQFCLNCTGGPYCRRVLNVEDWPFMLIFLTRLAVG